VQRVGHEHDGLAASLKSAEDGVREERFTDMCVDCTMANGAMSMAEEKRKADDAPAESGSSNRTTSAS
jgi:hypothetical protein